MSSKDQIIEAVRALAKDRDLDPQSRYDMLDEIGTVLDDESDTLMVENDLDQLGEWEPIDDEYDDDFDDDFDDEYDDEYDWDDFDEYDDEYDEDR